LSKDDDRLATAAEAFISLVRIRHLPAWLTKSGECGLLRHFLRPIGGMIGGDRSAIMSQSCAVYGFERVKMVDFDSPPSPPLRPRKNQSRAFALFGLTTTLTAIARAVKVHLLEVIIY
jgi:hypothetical protein